MGGRWSICTLRRILRLDSVTDKRNQGAGDGKSRDGLIIKVRLKIDVRSKSMGDNWNFASYIRKSQEMIDVK